MADYASNTVYFKMFNEDYRKSGLIHYLDNSQLRMYVILQAYANSHGNIVKENGNSYSLNELSDMVGMNFRTTKRALMDLTNNGYLIIDNKNVINIRTFLFDQTKRKDNNRTGKARASSSPGYSPRAGDPSLYLRHPFHQKWQSTDARQTKRNPDN